MATLFSTLLGAVLVAIGLWGVFTGAHDHTIAGLGVNAAHNVVHLASGALALVAALAGPRTAKLFCLGFGVVYGAVAAAGYANVPPVVRMLNLTPAGNAFHAGIAALCLWVGAVSRE